jgi:hypothetical protein
MTETLYRLPGHYDVLLEHIGTGLRLPMCVEAKTKSAAVRAAKAGLIDGMWDIGDAPDAWTAITISPTVIPL